MTEPRRRSAWSAFADEWDPDHPALVRMRDALALGNAPQSPPEAPGRAEPAAVVPESEPDYPEPQRAHDRIRVAELVQRVRSGDLSAVDILRRIIDRG